jgi:hypothetical protein
MEQDQSLGRQSAKGRMNAHIKHIVWAVAAIVIVIGGLIVRGKYEAMVADRMAKRDEQISANQVKSAQVLKDNKTDTDSITKRDLQNAVDVAALHAQASQPLTAAQVDAIIAARLSGATKGKDAQGNETTTVNAGYLADTLNRYGINQQICDKNLSTCEADKANLNQIIGRLTNASATDQGTIKLQGQQIKELQNFQVPRWTAMFGAGKSQGTDFQTVQSYQPVLGLDYRLSRQFGIFTVVQNKSAAAGLSWHFGGVPK